MARRPGLRHGQVVPGLSDAFALRMRRFADRWACPRNSAAELADAAERGEPFEVDGQAVWLALFAVDHPSARRFERDRNRYRLTAPDRLEITGTTKEIKR